MTPNDQYPEEPRAAGDSAGERILDHNRLQLSAFLDGELPADEAKFLWRRLQHDDELRGCWERWHCSGDVMRGQVGRCAPAGFSARVADAIAAQTDASRRGDTATPRWARWGGGAALAASVAVVALFLTRQAPDLRPAATTPTPIAGASSAPIERVPLTHVPLQVTAAPAPTAPDHTGQLATALAVADAPRRLAHRRSRGQSQRAAIRSNAGIAIDAPSAIAVAAGPFSNAAAPVDPFSGQHVRLANRPWPRALLPGSSSGGVFNVDYGNRSGLDVAPLSPFAPRVAPAAPNDAQASQPPSR
ncbi:MAG: RseA family anti-sigma factor [Luteimonas sp.]